MKNIQSLQHILLDQLSVPTYLFISYPKLGLNETELMVILHIHRFQSDNNMFPTPTELASSMTIGEEECSNILRKLVQKQFLNIEQMENEKNQLSETYSLQPLWEKIYLTENNTTEEMEGTLFILFEQEFGRPLSPFEIETVNAWLDEDQLSPALIKAALRESVLMGKLNFKYIDRILRDWKNKGIHTVDEARNASKKFHHNQRQRRKDHQPKRDTSFYYNWLEGEDS